MISSVRLVHHQVASGLPGDRRGDAHCISTGKAIRPCTPPGPDVKVEYTKIAADWTSERCTAEYVKSIPKNGLQTPVVLPPQSLLHQVKTLENSDRVGYAKLAIFGPDRWTRIVPNLGFHGWTFYQTSGVFGGAPRFTFSSQRSCSTSCRLNQYFERTLQLNPPAVPLHSAHSMILCPFHPFSQSPPQYDQSSQSNLLSPSNVLQLTVD
ncbi:hypothetical protein BC826DRAFT_448170 [Russula brevipes]|nr:hypothetical protein BC826DRAFT_448170 [Russula brevipes]